MARARRTTLLAVAATATLAVATAVVVLAPLPGTPVARPADDAAPEDVVHAYTAALAAHDCDTVSALRTPSAPPSAWCDALSSLTDVRVGTALADDAAASTTGAASAVHVPVTFTVDWRPFRDDGSMDEGPTTWGYVLVRETAADPWRVADEGVG